MQRQVLFLAVCFGVAAALGGLALRAQSDPASLPARDSHQGLLVAVKPYISPESYKEKFGKHTPYEAGILALEVYFRNDNEAPIRLDLHTLRLRVGQPGQSRQRIEPLSPDDVADRVLLKGSKDPSPQPRLPFPVPGRTVKTGRNKDWQEFASLLRSASVATDLLPPQATVHGFLYFDVAHHYDWLPSATLDVPDLKFMTTDQPLFFFSVDLAPALH